MKYFWSGFDQIRFVGQLWDSQGVFVLQWPYHGHVKCADWIGCTLYWWLSASYKREWTGLGFCEVCFWKKLDQTRLKCDDRQIQYATKYLGRVRLFEVRPKVHASPASQP
jgi:hypothetical protein